MPRQPTGTIFKTQHGYGIRWPENGKKPQRSGFATREDARAWWDANVRSYLARGVTRREGWAPLPGQTPRSGQEGGR